jgi:putative membrane protein
MGAADVVPGVSGGTIAFITGIYSQLLAGIQAFDITFFRLFLTGHFKTALARIPWAFLLPLLCGIGISILSLARYMLFMLHTCPEPLWSFFFGLILASMLLMQQGRKLSQQQFIFILLGAIPAWLIAGAGSMEMSHTLPFIFMSGAAALCAMILPGISGSFILVLLGQYTTILSALVHLNLPVLITFAAGGICGIMAFSRILTVSLCRFPQQTHALLIGVMAGCLRTVWPWHEGTLPSLPAQIDLSVLVIFLACLIGTAIPFVIQKIASRSQH